MDAINSNVSVSTPFSPTLGAFYMFHAYYNGLTGKVGLAINNGAPVESLSSTGLGGVWATASNQIYLGDGVGNALLDEYAIFPYKLSATHLGFIYNGGAGRTWPF